MPPALSAASKGHTLRFTACVRLENGRNCLSEWKLEDLPRFTQKLRASDQLAVEMTGNTRFFHKAVARRTWEILARGGQQSVQAGEVNNPVVAAIGQDAVKPGLFGERAGADEVVVRLGRDQIITSAPPGASGPRPPALF